MAVVLALRVYVNGCPTVPLARSELLITGAKQAGGRALTETVVVAVADFALLLHVIE